jgi:hypothetical protein
MKKNIFKKNKYNAGQQGFATLMAVLIVGAIGAAVAVSFLNRGIEASKNTNSLEFALRARLLADQCAELALQDVRNNTAYVGKGSSSNSTGTCTYEVVQLGGNRRNITATGVSGDSTKKILVEIDGINPKIIIISWREVL